MRSEVFVSSLAGERLFDGKTDVEIFKKIRACKIPPIAALRPDVPPGLSAVLDLALAPDPANRYTTAAEFANALSQVMKQAVGVDPISALGTAVREARMRDRPSEINALTQAALPMGSDAKTIPAVHTKHESVDVEFSAADINTMDAIDLTPKKK